jgi:hypothetical protein
VDPQIVGTPLYNLISPTTCLPEYACTRLNLKYSILAFLNRQSTNSLAGGRVNRHKHKKICFNIIDTLPLLGAFAKLWKTTIRFVINFIPITKLVHKFLYSYNVTVLYMFREVLCSSSGGKIVCIQHTVSSLSKSVSSCHTVHRLRENFSLNLCTARPPQPLIQSDDTICCIHTVWPPEDEHNTARNM